jgi:ATP-dependent helicase IRC3
MNTSFTRLSKCTVRLLARSKGSSRIVSQSARSQHIYLRLAHSAATAIKAKEVEPFVPPIPLNSPIQLRPYQQECLESIQAALARGVSRIGVSSPTGSGKTTIFGELIEAIPSPSATCHRILILVSSIQLAQQAANHISRRYPDLWVEIEQGTKYKATGYADVTVATWQTLVSIERSQKNDNQYMERMRLEKFDAAGYKAVIVDEAHHAASKSWRTVLNHFDSRIWVEGQAVEAEKQASTSKVVDRFVPIIGFSATFSRHDGISLGAVFDEIVYHKDILDLIEEEWLSPLRFTSIQAQIPLDTVKLADGKSDFSTTSLARVINTEPINKLIVRSWLSRTQGNDGPRRSRTLVFAVDIQHVKDLTEHFRQAGVDARYLTGSTLISERKQLLSDFGDGVFPVLVNCGE